MHIIDKQTINRLTDRHRQQKQRLTKQKHGPGWSALAYMKKSNRFELI